MNTNSQKGKTHNVVEDIRTIPNKENSLGNPPEDTGYFLTSDISGQRSWEPVNSSDFTGIFNPQNGILIKTPFTIDATGKMFNLQIRGMAFGVDTIFTEVSGNHNGTSFNSVSGIHFGYKFELLALVDSSDNTIAFYIPQSSLISNQTWLFRLYENMNISENSDVIKQDITVTDSVQPTSSEEVSVVFKSYIEEGSAIDADTLDGLDSTDFALVNHNHDTEYVNLSGDTMTGTLDMGANSIVNVQQGTNGTDVAILDDVNAVQTNLDNHLNDNDPHGLGFIDDTGDGSSFLANDGTYKVVQTTPGFDDITGSPYDNPNLGGELNKKVSHVVLTTPIDLDTMNNFGIYYVQVAMNAPSTSQKGTLYVSTGTGTGAETEVQQMWQTDKSIFVRHKPFGSLSDWTEWVTFASMRFDGKSLFIDL